MDPLLAYTIHLGLRLHAPLDVDECAAKVIPDSGPMYVYMLAPGEEVLVPPELLPATVQFSFLPQQGDDPTFRFACVCDPNGDDDCGTDADIQLFFSCLEAGGIHSPADFNGDGVPGTAEDIIDFFQTLAGC